MQYQFIKDHNACYPIQELCDSFGLSRSGYYEIAPKIGDPLCLGCYLDSFDLLMSNPMAAPAGAAIGFAVFSWAH